jgi:serine/threonine-protein kinase
MGWIEEHYDVILPLIKQHQGVVVKTIGDSVMAYFSDAKQAAEAALAIERGIHHGNAKRDPDHQMYVRVALHHGLAYLRGGDVFGDVVNVAARIAKACLPAQVLVSEALYVSAHAGLEATFRPAGEFRFHGKAASEKLYEILWADEDTYQQLRQKFPPKAQGPQEETREGRYIIMAELGRGAMGVVYKAYDRLIGRLVAMKTIPVEVEPREYHMLLDRLKQEARAAGMLDHPNIVTVFDVGDEAGLFYFTMQYVEGRTLESLRQEKELLPVEQVLDIAEQACSALAFAHKAGIIHRDIKPSNLMLTAQGALKVMDFGIAKLGNAGLTKAGMVLGTPSYLAPEQAAGRRVDHRSDIFSFGSVLYELLTGEKAFPGESTTSIVYKVMNEDPIPPRIIEPSLPAGLEAIVHKALAKDPNQRFQSCDELLQALHDFRQKRVPADATVTSPAPVPSAPKKGHGAGWMVAVAAVIVLAAAVGFYAVWHRSSIRAPAPEARATQTAPSTTSAVERPQTAANTQPIPAPAPPAATESKPPESKPAAETPAVVVKAPEPAKKKVKVRAGGSETIAKPLTNAAAKKPAAEEGESAPPPVKAAKPSEAGRGSGMWTLADVPDLLAKADAYAGKGEYQKAILLYQEILAVDTQNRSAREGLRRAQEARGIRR